MVFGWGVWTISAELGVRWDARMVVLRGKLSCKLTAVGLCQDEAQENIHLDRGVKRHETWGRVGFLREGAESEV